MSRFQITYPPMIWLIILATILYRRLKVSMTHCTPFSHLSLLTTMAIRPQITWAHAQTVLILIPRECAEFPNFKTLTQDQVSLIIGQAAIKFCPLDPEPTSVVLQVLDVLLPVITCMINMSFESALFAEEWRQDLVLPTLKKCGLDIAYKNFRPVSNLPYVSKLSERAAADQLIDHMTINGLHLELQSAFKKHY